MDEVIADMENKKKQAKEKGKDKSMNLLRCRAVDDIRGHWGRMCTRLGRARSRKGISVEKLARDVSHSLSPPSPAAPVCAWSLPPFRRCYALMARCFSVLLFRLLFLALLTLCATTDSGAGGW